MERRPEFPPSPGCPPTPPHSTLRVYASNLRSVSVHTQSSLYSANMVTAVTGLSRNMTPDQLPKKKPQRHGFPDTKHDSVMSYHSVFVCMIHAKGYATTQCKLTVLICKRSEGLQLNFKAISAGACSCEGVRLPFVKAKPFSLSGHTLDPTILLLMGHL